MGWKERPVWMQSSIALLFLVIWFLAVFVEISFLINLFFAVAGAAILLVVCNRSRQAGAISGGVIYLLFIAFASWKDAQCFILAREGSLCGLVTSLVSVFGWVLIPLGVLVGGMVGWIVGKIKEKK